MSLLPVSFYQKSDVVHIAKSLIGKMIFTQTDPHQLTGGIITETEAYGGVFDRACHAYKGRKTERTKTLYRPGGVAYVYQCYGIHYLLNVVTNLENIPEAVLIRGIFPIVGLEIMEKRRKKSFQDPFFTSGPGSVCQALNITKSFNGESFLSKKIWIEDVHFEIPTEALEISTRIGIEYAKEDAHKPWRFCLKKENYAMLNSIGQKL